MTMPLKASSLLAKAAGTGSPAGHALWAEALPEGMHQQYLPQDQDMSAVDRATWEVIYHKANHTAARHLPGPQSPGLIIWIEKLCKPNTTYQHTHSARAAKARKLPNADISHKSRLLATSAATMTSPNLNKINNLSKTNTITLNRTEDYNNQTKG